MAVQAGWVGTSAKAETGMAWMGDARVALRLPRAGWMSEMIGKSTEVLFINTVNRTQANIHALMGSPTVASTYIFENTATISAATQSGWALQTGAFPAGSVLKVINKGHIRGGGGNGGISGNGGTGGAALIIDFPASIDNTTGTIWGGGGGGGGAAVVAISGGGGGGAGIPAGAAGAGTVAGAWGSETGGGGGGVATLSLAGGAGGGLGAAGAAGADRAGAAGAGGRGGYSVQTNGNAVSWIATGDIRGSVV